MIAATNKDLIEEVQAGKFREDLYFRLNVLALHIPSLKRKVRGHPPAGGGAHPARQQILQAETHSNTGFLPEKNSKS